MRSRFRRHPITFSALGGVVVLFIIAGLAAGPGRTTTARTQVTASSAQVASSSSTTPSGVARPKAKPNAELRRRGSSFRGLAVSTASNDVVQPQPSPGSCHAREGGVLPDPTCTPGAVNPEVTQADIGRTICVTGWSETVRPSEGITEQEKIASIAAHGDRGSVGSYEYDHLVPLELGGATNDSRNLWPEPGRSPNPKDEVENALRREVCDGALTLATAQHIMAANWTRWARANGYPSGHMDVAPTPHHSS